jgi:alkylation response protein AidB-like acyl-CoA dehydrogenase
VKDLTVDIPNRAELLDRVDQIADLLERTAARSEQARRLCPEAVDALFEQNLFRLWSPVEAGGYDASYADQIDVMIALAHADMSACWNVMIGCSVSAVMATGLGDSALQQVFGGSRWPVAAGALMPAGRAHPTDDGYCVSGKWGFGSGIHHSSYIVANCLVAEADKPRKPIQPVSVVIPIDQVTIINDWQVAGLCASGSSSYSVSDVLVSNDFVLSPTPLRGSVHNASMVPRIPIEHASVSLGGVRHALDTLMEQAQNKRRLMDTRTVASMQAFHIDLARLNAQWTTLKAGVHHAADLLSTSLENGGDDIPRMTLHLRSVCAHVTQACHDIGVKALRYAGAAAIHRDNVLQRIVRDLSVSAQHVMVSDAAHEDFGKALLEHR